MRQVFFLLVSAMVAAFSLSWAAPGKGDPEYLVPEEVILPMHHPIQSKLEISSMVSLKDSCEKIENVFHEVRGAQIILAVKVLHVTDSVCLRQVRSNIAVNFVLENLQMNSAKQIDVYFREDEENLKYFGSVALK